MTLIFASNNEHKLAEVRSILTNHTILSLRDIGFLQDIDETGCTLEENSRIKAEAVQQFVLQHGVEADGIFSDDTGLEIAALGGEPGVYTARWAGEPANDAANRKKALQELEQKTDRTAQFRTVVTIIQGQETRQIDGIVRGMIATEECGDGGFGYDQLFIPEGYEKTFAELPAKVKNTISHRARAMEALRKVLALVLLCLCLPCTFADTEWVSHLAYNDVTQIAVTPDKTYAVSNGQMFSVNKMTEKIEKYDNFSGLHGTNITGLFYDQNSQSMLIAYANGKLDLMTNNRIEYISGLYTKDIMSDKTVNNITIHNGRAFLSTAFGIVTFAINRHELVDTYYIGAEAREVNVKDINIVGDSIYAYTDQIVYKAALADNIVDYRVWLTEPLPGRIPRDPNKGRNIVDENGDRWSVSSQGIERHFRTGGSTHYLPDGPLKNLPYSMYVHDGKLYVLPGGYWVYQNRELACIMYYDGRHWDYVDNATLQAAAPCKEISDFTYMAFDPRDKHHYYITSYGTGAYEFRDFNLVRHFTTGDESTLSSAVANDPELYTRVADVQFDSQGNVYMLQAHRNATYTIVIRLADDSWSGINLYPGGKLTKLESPTDLIIDQRNENHKWVVSGRESAGLILLDDKGTITDESDDESVIFRSWVDQDGTTIAPNAIYSSKQLRNHDILLGTDIGIIILPHDVDYMQSNVCQRLRIPAQSGYLIEDESVMAIEQDEDGQIWLGTQVTGVHLISEDYTQLIEHYSTDNSSMPSNYVFSICRDIEHQVTYIGTTLGIAAQQEIPTGLPVDKDGNPIDDWDYGVMGQWQLHNAYSKASEVTMGNKDVYCLSAGAIFSVNKMDETITTLDKTTGLNGSSAAHIAFDKTTDQLLVAYNDGMIDIVDKKGNVHNMSDIQQKGSSMPTSINSIYIHDNGETYLSMQFGVIRVNMHKHEIQDTYYVGDSASSVNILACTILGDSLYALSDTTIYCVHRNSNLVDYHYWQTRPLANKKEAQNLVTLNDNLYLLQGKSLFRLETNTWVDVLPSDSLEWMTGNTDCILGHEKGVGLLRIDPSGKTPIYSNACAHALYESSTHDYWLAYSGLTRLQDGNTQVYCPDGPIVNDAATMKFASDRLFICPGDRWAIGMWRTINLSMYNADNTWSWSADWRFWNQFGFSGRDAMSIAVDPKDNHHFWLATYAYGVIEYIDDQPIRQFTEGTPGCTLKSCLLPSASGHELFVRTDAATIDEHGNLMVLNTGTRAKAINLLTPDGKWYAKDLYVNGQKLTLETPGSYIIIDNRNTNYKWMFDCRQTPGIILHNDGGTPLDTRDDHTMKRNVFIDQFGAQVMPEYIYCMAQDHNNDLWIGTPTGVFNIKAETDFFHSNECYRVYIERNDGTNIVDYLLGTEQVNCIAVDGANRKWFGTQRAGIFLMSADGKETIAHFTEENSSLPSNQVQCIAINHKTGEVFAGTAKGIASYKSDASEGKEDLSGAYAYPNPVRPNYVGLITISGLMENTEVNIIDGGGNLVCKTRSNGGTAVWDGKNQLGQRVKSGVYTALCNTAEGKQHTVVKILIMN